MNRKKPKGGRPSAMTKTVLRLARRSFNEGGEEVFSYAGTDKEAALYAEISESVLYELAGLPSHEA